MPQSGTVDGPDAWRRRMGRTAEKLRRMDARLFERQIAFIQECLDRDAAWNLEAALTSLDRWPSYSSAGAVAENS